MFLRARAVCVCVFLVIAVHFAAAESQPENGQLELFKDFANQAVQPHMKKILRLIIEADVSGECQIYLAKFGQALRKFEPWSIRMLDATGKGINGLFQGTLSSPGAYDECLETVIYDEDSGEETLRGQYCNVYLKSFGSFVHHIRNSTALSHPRTPMFVDFQGTSDLPGMHMGLCIAKQCNLEDLQKLGRKIGTFISADVTVRNCVDGLPRPLDGHQISAIVLVAIVATLVVLGTLIDFATEQPKNLIQHTKQDQKRSIRDGIVVRTFLCFSARANTNLLLEINQDPTTEAYAYRFLHGMRFFSMYGVVLGHSFTVFNQTISARLVNALHYGDSLWFCLIMSGYLCVDTFLFIGGFLLTYNLLSAKEGRWTVSIIALIRRFIRGTLPALFVMVLIFLIPVIFDGPRIQEWYVEYKGQFAFEWITVVLQFRNFIRNQFTHGAPCMGHLWYLSVDYQLFLIVVVTVALANRKEKIVHWMMACYSLACALFIAIYIYDTELMPFVLPMAENWDIIKRTIFEFYMYTPIHATLYFMGVSTVYLIRRYKETKISPLVYIAFWAITISSVVVAVFGTYPWNHGDYPRESIKVLFALGHRPMWGLFLMWLTFCCSTGRAKAITSILSSSVFVPLSRLTFGVYLIHLPLFFVEIGISRQTIYYDAINALNRSFSCLVWGFVLAYFIFLLVEAPLGRLEKMILQGLRKRSTETKKQVADVENGEKRHPAQMITAYAEHANGHSNNGFTQSHEQLPTFNGHSVKL